MIENAGIYLMGLIAIVYFGWEWVQENKRRKETDGKILDSTMIVRAMARDERKSQ